MKPIIQVLTIILLGLFVVAAASIMLTSLEDPPAAGDTPGRLTLDWLEATPISPDPRVTDLRREPWQQVVVAADGRTIDVYFLMGMPACHGLHSVTVERTDSGIELEILTGTPPALDLSDPFAIVGWARDTLSAEATEVCLDIPQPYVTTVVLHEPLIDRTVE